MRNRLKKRNVLHSGKRWLAILLSICMIAGMVPVTARADSDDSGTTSKSPSVSVFATKEQMMDDTFAPNSNGEAANYGKLVIGKKSDGTTAQEWYILGKDDGVSGDNTIIFAASPIATNQMFEDDYSNNKNFQESFGVYETNPTDVYPNHYGASDLRVALQNMVDGSNTSYFTTAEQGLMNATEVTTNDTKNGVDYTTADKLYALAAESLDDTTIKAGSDNSTVLAMSSYWSSGDWFWLRSPRGGIRYGALLVFPVGSVRSELVYNERDVQPASNLNLSSVLFASAAKASSSGALFGTIADGTAMTLRLDGTSKNIGTARYNTTTGDINATKGSTSSQSVALVVQGNDGTHDWYYSKQITGTDTVKASDIKAALNLSSDIDLSTCKIWLEITDADGMIYAVNAEKEIEKINTTYVTKEQLMNSFKPYSDGTAANYGKLVFGKNSSGDAQEWYILGADSRVTGGTDNTIIFAASPIVTGQMFNSGTSNKTYTYEAGTGYGDSAGSTTVSANHYGASELRDTLQTMAAKTSYFTIAEQNLMNDTTVKTKDTNNNVNYTTTDKLYALAAESYTDTTIKAGSDNNTVLAEGSYWDIGEWFWLRSPNIYDSDFALLAYPGFFVDNVYVYRERAVRPASNLNLSSVLFASAAKAASSDMVSATIADGTAMTLRLDGKDTAIGTVMYDDDKGYIVAKKDSTASGAVSLVVQGNDGTNDWYYSVPAGETTFVTANEIKDKLSLNTAPDLSDCKIWLETTIDNISYAKMAGSKTIALVNDVNITGMKPVAGTTLNDKASCTDTGIVSTPDITYTTIGDSGEEVIGIAGWNTTYKATVKLATNSVNDTVYVFGDAVNVTIDGESLTDAIKPNSDGTLTVIKEFTTEKRKIASVTAPTAPNDNTFANYYGYDGDADSPISGSISELGTNVTVTFTDSETDTEDIDVTWTIDGNEEYNKEPGAENTFRWTITADKLADYDAAGCAGYDAATGTITGTVTINNNVTAKVIYEILEGADSNWKQNTDGTVTIRGNGDFAKFIGVKVDGSQIDAKNYTAREGSTIIILTSDYLKTLSVGTHTFEIVWTDGTAGTSFTVSKDDSGSEAPKDEDDGKSDNDNSDNNPAIVPDDRKDSGNNADQSEDNQQIEASQTGDNTHMMSWVALLAASLAGLVSLLCVRKKKEDE